MRGDRRDRGRPAPITWLLLALLVHGVIGLVVVPLWPERRAAVSRERSSPVQVNLLKPQELLKPEEPLVEPPPTPPTPMGQIVDIAAPEEQVRPLEAKYLAEFDRTVPKETRTDQFRINPEVLAEKFSTEAQEKMEEVLEVTEPDPSTGAPVKKDSFEPDRDGNLASIPSPFAATNRDGMKRPAAASQTEQSLSGSPSNDRLREELGDRVALNSIAVPYANYVNRISRMVSFYVDQNLNNLSRSTRITKPQYEINAYVVLSGKGELESIEIRQSSGVPNLDQTVLDAFRVAGPFPNPPSQLIGPDGKVYLPTFGYEINFRQGGMVRGPDPNAGVQYPGMLKTNR